MRKKIAVLVAQVDERTQNRFLSAFMKEAYANDYDLFVFTMYQKYQETWLRDMGDSNIFELVDFSMFSAVLVMIDTLLTPGLEERLQKRIKDEFEGPVLVVDKESPFFPSVMMDHYTPVKKLVDHLIEVHGYKDIAFLGGKEGHPHSVQRLNGYLDSMKEHGLAIKDEWIYHGNYWYDSAEDFVDLLLKNREHLPRALACANDCMAIGAAVRLTENGIRVPEDVALIGYDSTPDGKDSPEPLTSANIPADECGTYCFHYLWAKMEGREVPEFKPNAPLFIGSSCGCGNAMRMVPRKRRKVWKTRQSTRGVFSDFNHILEDLLSHYDMTSFLETVKDYSYQIQPFYSFDLCLNEGFLDPERNVGVNAMRKGYTKRMYHVLGIGEGREELSPIQLERAFKLKKLLPVSDEERTYPTTYIFNPVYFEDRCFGYTVLNNGSNIALYEQEYRIWMRNIMQGFEAFYRLQFMQELVMKIQSDQVRDSLTGLYNYEGFVKQVELLCESKQNTDKVLGIIAIDMKGLKNINEMYGRASGDKCIKLITRFLTKELGEDEIGARMCNDEFIVAFFDTSDGDRNTQIITNLRNKLQKNPVKMDSLCVLDFCHADVRETLTEQISVEALINRAINLKNYKKRKQSQDETEFENVENEIKQNQLVEYILNKNLFTYHYQPIISTTDGSIYAYEALMRHVDGEVTPIQIIKSATYLKRLNDVERATLLNVTKDVEAQADSFTGKKVFFNSIPGTVVSDADDEVILERMRRSRGRYVVEFTEENEMDDDILNRLNTKLKSIGADIAIDDFGVGYSNVSTLLRYMPRYIKVDRSLIESIQNHPQKQHFVRSIIEFAHENEILVLAEGVETQEELKECIYLGMDLIQGFYTGRPQRKVVQEVRWEVRSEIMRFRVQAADWRAKFV